ncbi:plakophilin-1-like protein [Labeo rohita]|nr:plakophilin-1-like protein [Labeo rohita]
MRLLENNLLTNTSQSQVASIKPSLNQSQTVRRVNTTMKKKQDDHEALGGAEGSITDITLEEAVEYLSHSDISHQLCGASFIQHQTFTDDKAKQEVWRLGGIPALISLLKGDDQQLQQVSAAALRNLVYKDSSNKIEVDRCEGVDAILTLLRDTNVTETQKQLTGLLWNLSSADALKPELITNALPLLTESIVVPYSFWTDSNTSKHIDPEVFCNTTGCLRNLSCASESERSSMRSCPQLIDSLMTYIQTLMDRGDPDDKELNFPAMEQKEPKGVDWLYNQKSLQLYLSLLRFSQNEATLEACCGALQNLTASKSSLSTLMSQNIIQKLNGLPVISSLLKSGNAGLQKTAMSLVGNMSRVSSLRNTMAKEVLPNIVTTVSAVTPKMVESDSTIATACRVMHTLMLADPDTGKKMISTKLIDSLTYLSTNISFETARKAAAYLLYNMWGQKDIHSVLKKQGMDKDTFINDVTAVAYQEATRNKRY